MGNGVEPLGIVTTAHLFPGLHARLMDVLHGLRPEDWVRPTLAGDWTVRDVVAHLLDGQTRRLSFQRDGMPLVTPDTEVRDYADLVAFLNRLNAEWLAIARRLSPRVLVEWLEVTGPKVAELFESLDPRGRAFFPVAWAGEASSANWLDIGREYTEWWHHQAQIREAVGAPLLTERGWLHPLLEISMKAFCRHLEPVGAQPGTTLVLRVQGEAGGAWSIVAVADGWEIFRGETPDPVARAECDADTAWRLFFNALPEAEARARIVAQGDEPLAERVFSVRGVMV